MWNLVTRTRDRKIQVSKQMQPGIGSPPPGGAAVVWEGRRLSTIGNTCCRAISTKQNMYQSLVTKESQTTARKCACWWSAALLHRCEGSRATHRTKLIPAMRLGPEIQPACWKTGPTSCPQYMPARTIFAKIFRFVKAAPGATSGAGRSKHRGPLHA